jgi:predicted permease
MFRLIEVFAQTTGYGFRQARRNRGFTAMVIVILALGIGADTAIFSLAEAALFPPFAVRDPGRLAGVYTSGPRETGYNSTSYPDYVYYRDHNHVFSGLMAYLDIQLRWTHEDQTSFPWAAIVTSNYFSVLGVKPVMGRVFLPTADRVGSESAVALVSDQFWTRQLASDPKVIGRQLVLNGHALTIVGVLPKNFQGVDLAWGGIPEIWIPVAMESVALPNRGTLNVLQSREAREFLVMGRLKQGVGIEDARAEMKLAARQLEDAYPVADKGRTAFVLTANDSRMWPGWRNSVVQVLSLLAVAVGFVLLVACANVANLLLTRGVARQREIAVRLALGSKRARVVLQLLTENLLLAVMGALGGLLFADLMTRIAPSFELSPQMHMNLNLRIDYRVFLFTLLLSLIVALIFGLIPAFTASQVNLTRALKGGSDHSSSHIGGRRVRGGIVIVELAFAFLCLIGGGLFVRSLVRLENADLGFDPHNVLAASLFLSPSRYTPAQASRFYAQLLDRVSGAPGVKSACLTVFRPLNGLRTTRQIFPEGLEGMESQGEEAGITVQTDDISPGYFRLLGIPLLRGRGFTPEDGAQAPPVVIVNQALAASVWPHQNPVGKLLKLQGENTDRQVVGVVADMKYHTIWEGPEPYLYLPLAQEYAPEVTLLVRTKGNPMSFLPEVRQSVGAQDKKAWFYEAQTLQEGMNHSLSQPRAIATLLTLFAAIAVLLATVGIYGVVSYSVAHRTHEIGIRMALGARRADVLRLILQEAMLLVAAGIGAGAFAAIAVGRLMATLLYGVKSTDPFTFVVVSLIFIGVALAASYIPARRATRIDPMLALRHE